MKKLLLLFFFPFLFNGSDEYVIKLVSLPDFGCMVTNATEVDGHLLFSFCKNERNGYSNNFFLKTFYSEIQHEGSLSDTLSIGVNVEKMNYPRKKQLVYHLRITDYLPSKGELFFSCFYYKKSKGGAIRQFDGRPRNRIGVGRIENKNFKGIKLLPFCEEEGDCINPTISEDGNTMIFAADLGSECRCDFKLYESKWQESKKVWSEPILIEELESGYPITSPNLINDSLLVYSFDDPEFGLGGRDIYKSEKINGVWTFPENWEELNSEHDDFGLEMIDEKSGYFSSTRDSVDAKLYYFEIKKTRND